MYSSQAGRTTECLTQPMPSSGLCYMCVRYRQRDYRAVDPGGLVTHMDHLLLYTVVLASDEQVRNHWCLNYFVNLLRTQLKDQN